MNSKNKQPMIPSFVLAILLLAFVSTGCTMLGLGGGGEEQMAPLPASQPYYPKDFKAIMVPDGLTMNRDNTMFVKTSSFNGGILNFQGRLEVNSLTEFFENSMPKNGWQLSGSVKAQKNLLIFTKPDKTCMITIAESQFKYKTDVNIYFSENVPTSFTPLQ